MKVIHTSVSHNRETLVYSSDFEREDPPCRESPVDLGRRARVENMARRAARGLDLFQQMDEYDPTVEKTLRWLQLHPSLANSPRKNTFISEDTGLDADQIEDALGLIKRHKLFLFSGAEKCA